MYRTSRRKIASKNCALASMHLSNHGRADPALAKIAHELVEGIRTDLTVDWADREATEAKVRAKIKRLLRKHKYQPPKPKPTGGGESHGFETAAQLVLDQAKAFYRYGRKVKLGHRRFA